MGIKKGIILSFKQHITSKIHIVFVTDQETRHVITCDIQVSQINFSILLPTVPRKKNVKK